MKKMKPLAWIFGLTALAGCSKNLKDLSTAITDGEKASACASIQGYLTQAECVAKYTSCKSGVAVVGSTSVACFVRNSSTGGSTGGTTGRAGPNPGDVSNFDPGSLTGGTLGGTTGVVSGTTGVISNSTQGVNSAQ